MVSQVAQFHLTMNEISIVTAAELRIVSFEAAKYFSGCYRQACYQLRMGYKGAFIPGVIANIARQDRRGGLCIRNIGILEGFVAFGIPYVQSNTVVRERQDLPPLHIAE
jgi:hypothetical protein